MLQVLCNVFVQMIRNISLSFSQEKTLGVSSCYKSKQQGCYTLHMVPPSPQGEPILLQVMREI